MTFRAETEAENKRLQTAMINLPQAQITKFGFQSAPQAAATDNGPRASPPAELSSSDMAVIAGGSIAGALVILLIIFVVIKKGETSYVAEANPNSEDNKIMRGWSMPQELKSVDNSAVVAPQTIHQQQQQQHNLQPPQNQRRRGETFSDEL